MLFYWSKICNSVETRVISRSESAKGGIFQAWLRAWMYGLVGSGGLGPRYNFSVSNSSAVTPVRYVDTGNQFFDSSAYFAAQNQVHQVRFLWIKEILILVFQ